MMYLFKSSYTLDTCLGHLIYDDLVCVFVFAIGLKYLIWNVNPLNYVHTYLWLISYAWNLVFECTQHK